MNPPEPLKAIIPFLQRASELQQREPVVAYYCNYYAAKSALSNGSAKTNKECSAFIVKLMDKLEQDKKLIENQEAITNDTVGYAHVENFALKVFLNADNEDRTGKITKQTARKFLAASLFLELLGVFGDYDSQIVEKIRYAKWKAVDITKAFREGRTPTSGPPGGDLEDQKQPTASLQDPASLSLAPTAANTMPNISSIHISQAASPSIKSPAPAAAFSTPVPSSTTIASAPLVTAANTSSARPSNAGSYLEPKVSEQVEKHCRYTISAIQYNDVATAIDNLEKALALLRNFSNK